MQIKHSGKQFNIAISHKLIYQYIIQDKATYDALYQGLYKGINGIVANKIKL